MRGGGRRPSDSCVPETDKNGRDAVNHLQVKFLPEERDGHLRPEERGGSEAALHRVLLGGAVRGACHHHDPSCPAHRMARG